MQKSTLLALALVGSSAVAVAAAEVAAVVNGTSIEKSTVDRYVQMRAAQQPGAHDSKQVLEELINRELLYQEAVKAGLEKDPDVAFQLQEHRITTLASAMASQTIRSKPITDAELRKEYDQLVAHSQGTEYKARHILVKSEADAKAVIVELDKGADFQKLAKERSTGPSGKQGGDLGWFAASQMVPPFSQAVSEMKKGTYSKTPVKTQFGWHVILLEDTRARPAPKFEDTRPQLEKMVQSKRLNDHIKALRDKAKIKIN